MSKVVTGVIFMLSLNLVLFLMQTAALDVNPSGTQFFSYSDSPLSQYDSGNYTLTTDVADQLPTGESGLSPETGGLFTDIFSTLKSWFYSVPGVRYLVGFVTAVPNFINGLNWPPEFAFGISAIWYVTAALLIVLLWTGRDD